MRKIYTLFFLMIALAFTAKSQSTIVISQVYGGGGGASGTYKYDYVELHNVSTNTQSLDGKSLQYGSATGNFGSVATNIYAFPAGTSIAPGKYLLVQLSAAGTAGAELPVTPDLVTTNLTMSGASGKVALVNQTTALGCGATATPCTLTNPEFVDVVAYGSANNGENGTSVNNGNALTSTQGAVRKNNGCTDSNNNNSDFDVVTAPVPRNSSSTAVDCSASSISAGAITTAPFCLDASTTATGTIAFTATGIYNTTFTAYLSDASGSFAAPVSIGSTAVNGTNPSGTINITLPAGTASGTGYKIRVNSASPAVTGGASAAFEIINGAKNVSNVSAAPGSTEAIVSWTNPNACYDEVLIVAKAGSSVAATPTGDGTAYTGSTVFGSGTAFDGGFVVYKGTTSPQTITGLTNATTYYFKIFTRKGTNWSTGVEVSTTPNVLAAAGEIVINQISPDYNGSSDEYIELVNKTNKSFDLSAYAIRYQSATGTSGSAGGSLSGTLLPKRFWLLSPNTTVTVGLTNNLARDGAIVAGLSATAGQVALVRIADGVIVDAVGYGALTGGTFSEGTPAPAPPTDGGLKRTMDGGDTNNNQNDFSTADNATILLRNSTNAPLPVKFTNIKATQKAAGIQVNWTNMTESNVLAYIVERSANGSSFSAIGQVQPSANNDGRADYTYFDAAPLKGTNVYRIKSVEAGNKAVYSTIVRISTVASASALSIYPNPVNGSDALLQLVNLPAGNYTIRVINAGGQVISSRRYAHTGGSVNEELSLKTVSKGVYTVQVNGPVTLQQRFVKQ